MSEDRHGGGCVSPDASKREKQRQRVYQHGRRARRLKEAGRLWVQPHYPVADSDLAHAWLEGWEDMGEELMQ